MLEPIKQLDMVRWRTECINFYWKLFVKSIVDKTLQIPFTFERNSQLSAKCIGCDDIFDPKCPNIYGKEIKGNTAYTPNMSIMYQVI